MKISLVLGGLILVTSLSAQYTDKDAAPPPPPKPNPSAIQPQQAPPVFFFNVNAGVGQPIGGYSVNGCASTGGNLSVVAGLPFNRRIAIAFKFDYGWNSIDQLQFLDSVLKESNVPGLQLSFPTKPDSYTYEAFMIGINSTHQFQQCAIGSRFFIGDMFATIPALTLKGVYPTGQVQIITTTAATGQALTLDLGVFFKYNAQPDLAFTISIDYIYGNASFTDLQYSAPTAPQQVFSALNFDVGLEYTVFGSTSGPGKGH